MSEPTPTPEVHHHENAIDHFEEEFKNLEGVTRFGRPLRIGALVILLVGIVAVGVWWVASPPSHFAWESVTGRLQYIVRVYVKGTSTPILERMITTSSVELTTDEQARMPRGKTFVWTVVAQGKDGSTIGSGQATFKVR